MRRNKTVRRSLKAKRPVRRHGDFAGPQLGDGLLGADQFGGEESLLPASRGDGVVDGGFDLGPGGGDGHNPSSNPNLGTRQYPPMGEGIVPALGYPVVMGDSEERLGRLIARRRQQRSLSQEALGQLVGAGQSTVDRIESGNYKRMPSVMPKVLATLGIPMSEMDPTLVQSPGGEWNRPAAMLVGVRNFPVHAAAAAGGGSVIISTEPVDYVERPAPLAQVRDGYGVLVTLDSMVPEFRPGDTLLVHPHLPPERGEACVFYADDGHGTVLATVKSFVRSTSAQWFVEQWNPPKKFTLDRKKWQKAHRVVGKYSRR